MINLHVPKTGELIYAKLNVLFTLNVIITMLASFILLY